MKRHEKNIDVTNTFSSKESATSIANYREKSSTVHHRPPSKLRKSYSDSTHSYSKSRNNTYNKVQLESLRMCSHWQRHLIPRLLLHQLNPTGCQTSCQILHFHLQYILPIANVCNVLAGTVEMLSQSFHIHLL